MNSKRLLSIGLGVLLTAGFNAQAASYFEDFEPGNQYDPVTNYGFTQFAGGGSQIRNGMQIDPDGSALFGGGAWNQWNRVGIDTGVASGPGQVTVFRTQASAMPLADGQAGNAGTSHWGYFGVRDTVENEARVQWGVRDEHVSQGDNGWYFQHEYLSGVAGQLGGYNVHVPGFMGTWDAQNGKQEKIVELKIYIDRVNDVVWGSISDGSSTHTTAKVPIIQNESGIGTILTGSLTANTGAQTSEGIDIDNIKAFALNLPLEISRSGIGDTPGVQFQSESNATYRLQYAIPPDSSTWFETGAKIAGDGSMMTLFDPTGPSTTRVYRVMLDL